MAASNETKTERARKGEARWFIVLVQPNGEKKAALWLRKGGLRVYVPRQYRQIGRRRQRISKRALLTGYVLVRAPGSEAIPASQLFEIAHNSPGVARVLTYANEFGERQPFPLREKIVKDFIRRQRNYDFGRPAVDTEDKRRDRQREIFVPGRRLRVKSGPLVSFEAVVTRFDGLDSVEALISIFGRETKAVFTAPEAELAVLA